MGNERRHKYIYVLSLLAARVRHTKVELEISLLIWFVKLLPAGFWSELAASGGALFVFAISFCSFSLAA